MSVANRRNERLPAVEVETTVSFICPTCGYGNIKRFADIDIDLGMIGDDYGYGTESPYIWGISDRCVECGQKVKFSR